MNQDTQNFLEELKQKPEVLGVILFGSWARGNNRPNSDVDLVVIVNEGYRRTVEYKNDQAFEIIYTTAQSAIEFWQKEKDDCAELWSVAKIVYDKDHTVQKIKEQASAIIQQGKNPIDQYQKEQFRFSSEDQIRAVESLADKDRSTASLVLNYTVTNLTSQFFDLRQLWTPSPKNRLPKIKELRPELYLALEQFYKDSVSLEEKIDKAKRIVPLIFEN